MAAASSSLLSLRRKSVALRDDAVRSSVCSFVAWNAIGPAALRPLTTTTVGVASVSSLVKNFISREIYASGGGLFVAPHKRVTLIFVKWLNYTVSQKTALLFLSELRQISTNFNTFWQTDGTVAEIKLYGICTFST